MHILNLQTMRKCSDMTTDMTREFSDLLNFVQVVGYTFTSDSLMTI